jgi:hypothetical protein
VVVRSRMSEGLPCRSPVPCPHRFGFAMACRVKWMVSGRTPGGRRCPEPVRLWRPLWTPDTTTRTSDGTRLADVPGLAQVQVVMTSGPDAGSGWGGRRQACPRRPVRSGPGRADRVVGRGRLARRMVGRWALEVFRRRPDWVHTHQLGGHLELGMSGRSRGPPCLSPGQPLPGVRRRN